MDDDVGDENNPEGENSAKFLNIEYKKNIKSKVERQSFKIIENSAQGDCLFSSLQEFIENHEDRLNEKSNNIKDLRLRIVNYIMSTNAPGFISNWDRFADSLTFNSHKQIPSLLNINNNSKKNETARKNYFNYMSKSGHYGTFTELTVAAEIFGFVGFVIQMMEDGKYNCFEFGFSNVEEINNKKPKLFLLFSGPPDRGHFRFLQPRNKRKLDVIPICVYDQLQMSDSEVVTISNVIQLHSDKGKENNDSFACEICMKEKKSVKEFDTLKGLRIHCSKVHGVSDITHNSEDKVEIQEGQII